MNRRAGPIMVGVVALAGGLAGWAARRVERVQVAGDSMLPTLCPGDRLVVLRGRRVRVGDLVVVEDPRASHPAPPGAPFSAPPGASLRGQPDRVLVKRVAAVDGGTVSLLGDNPDSSTDSRHFGTVHWERIQGRVVYRYWPPQGAGRLGRATIRSAGWPDPAP